MKLQFAMHWCDYRVSSIGVYKQAVGDWILSKSFSLLIFNLFVKSIFINVLLHSCEHSSLNIPHKKLK